MHQHDPDELFEVDVPVPIDVRHRDHFLNFLLVKLAFESFADLIQLRLAEPLLVLGVKYLKGF